MDWYGVLQWIFMALGFVLAIVALLRLEVFSSNSSQRVKGHSQQQILLFFFAGVFMLAGFITAMITVSQAMGK